MKKKKIKPEPVVIKAQTLDQMFSEIANGPAPKPMTEQEQAELNILLQQLAESQGPGDSFMMLSIPVKKTKPK